MRTAWNAFLRRPRLRYIARLLFIWGNSKVIWLGIPYLFWTDEVQHPILYPLVAGYLMGWSFQPRVGRASGWRIIRTSALSATLVVLFDILVSNLWSLAAPGPLDLQLVDPFAIVLMLAGIVGVMILGAIGCAAGLAPAYLVPRPGGQAHVAPPAPAS